MRPVRLLVLLVVVGRLGLFVEEGVAGRRRLLALLRSASTARFAAALFAALFLLVLVVVFVILFAVAIAIIVTIFVRRKFGAWLVVSVVLLPHDDIFLLVGGGIVIVVMIQLVGAEKFSPARAKELATFSSRRAAQCMMIMT